MLQDNLPVVTVVGHPYLVYFALSSWKPFQLIRDGGVSGKGLERMQLNLDNPGKKNRQLLEQLWAFDPKGWTGDVLVTGKGFTLRVPFKGIRRGIVMRAKIQNHIPVFKSYQRCHSRRYHTLLFLLRKLFQEDVAHICSLLECSSLDYILFEENFRRPSRDQLEALARLYGLDLTSLVSTVILVNTASDQTLAIYDNLCRQPMRPFMPTTKE